MELGAFGEVDVYAFCEAFPRFFLCPSRWGLGIMVLGGFLFGTCSFRLLLDEFIRSLAMG